MEYLLGSRRSLWLDTRGLDHLAPFVGLISNEPAEVAGRTSERRLRGASGQDDVGRQRDQFRRVSAKAVGTGRGHGRRT